VRTSAGDNRTGTASSVPVPEPGALCVIRHTGDTVRAAGFSRSATGMRPRALDDGPGGNARSGPQRGYRAGTRRCGGRSGSG
jgi:hypothetical protein